MRLAAGIFIDAIMTLGELKFSVMRREVRKQNEDGTISTEIKERTYDLRSRVQGMMIQVSIPASVAEKTFECNTVVELVNPVIDTVASATYRGADINWYLKADDIILKQSNQATSVKYNQKEDLNQKTGNKQ